MKEHPKNTELSPSCNNSNHNQCDSDACKCECHWQEEFVNMFNWAEQVKDSEIERWKTMYGFTPEQLIKHVNSLVELSKELSLDKARRTIRDIYYKKYARVTREYTEVDHFRDDILKALSGIVIRKPRVNHD